MPVSTFSRRRSRREAVSDIEDEGPSNQPGKPGMEDVSDDEEEEEEEEEEEKIDINNFQDQPLRKSEAQKLLGIGKDWITMEKTVRQNWKVVGDVAVSIADSGEGDEVEKSLSELDAIMRDLIDIGEEMKFHEQTLGEMAQKIVQHEEINDALARYEQGVGERVAKYSNKTARQKYAKSEEYASFKHGIYEVQFPEKPLPPITEFIPKGIGQFLILEYLLTISSEPGDDSDDEDDLEVGGFIQVYTCPITLVPLVNPVTSDLCGHSFSSDAISQTFRGSRVVKCPAAGCNKQFTQDNLKPNKDLAKKVKAWQRRAQRAAENLDAEEIID